MGFEGKEFLISLCDNSFLKNTPASCSSVIHLRNMHCSRFVLELWKAADV